MEKKRSVGVTIFGWLYIVLAVLSFLPAIGGILEWQGWFYVISLFIEGALFLIIGVNILRLKNWVRIFLIWLNFILMGYFIIGTFFWEPRLLMGIVSLCPILLGINYFLTRPKVKEQFR